jgi:hypothetical protein
VSACATCAGAWTGTCVELIERLSAVRRRRRWRTGAAVHGADALRRTRSLGRCSSTPAACSGSAAAGSVLALQPRHLRLRRLDDGRVRMTVEIPELPRLGRLLPHHAGRCARRPRSRLLRPAVVSLDTAGAARSS